MARKREAISDKILILGLDGLDPRVTKTCIEKGLMPNTKEFLQRGAARDDLTMLGGQPTVTPPMWTTMATGCYPNVHGITCFNGKGETIDETVYNLDSRRCKAEPLWNVTAEAGKKTVVWHWPGSSWPPTSDNPNLTVVDGLTPPVVNSFASAGGECLVLGSDQNPNVVYKAKAASDGNVPCVINDDYQEGQDFDGGSSVGGSAKKIIRYWNEGEQGLSSFPFDLVYTPIKPADEKWADAPEGAKEITILFSGGLIRRPALILKNNDGIYDRIALYKSKKDLEPIAVLPKNVYVENIVDEVIYHDQKMMGNRNMRILDLGEDGNSLRMWISNAVTLGISQYFHPQSLYQEIIDNVGPIPPMSILGGADRRLIEECMFETWNAYGEWTAKALHYMIENKGSEIIFSHFHAIDLEGHMVVKFMKDHGKGSMSEAEYYDMFIETYIAADKYIGKFLHLLDEGWTVILLSDHAQVASEYEPLVIGDPSGTCVGLMQELGLTALKKDEEGNDLPEIDWEHTYAVQQRANHIYLNLKGREPHGIIDPKDQYEWEEEIMTRLYGYKHPVSGKRVIALALRNKDAVLLGMGGPDCGDILIWNAEGYNYDHADSLSTTYGYAGTSVSPIIIFAGKGIKEHFITERQIRQVDVTPTVAVLAGVRMPEQCEGAPVYQVLTEAY